MKHFKHFYWKFFFCAYWLVFDLGETKTPEKNASWLMEFTFIINLFSLIFLATFVNGGKLQYNKVYLISTAIASFAVNEYILFNRKKGYKTQSHLFEYLSNRASKKHRDRVVLLIVLFTFLIFLLSMIINNPNVISLLFN